MMSEPGFRRRPFLTSDSDTGGDLVSTQVAKQRSACQGPATLLNRWKAIVANDDTYALAA